MSQRARRSAATRDRVIAAAHRLFLEKGYEDTTIQDIAAAANVAVQTVLNHGGSKDELFFADRVCCPPATCVPPSVTPGVAGAEAVVSALTTETLRYLAGLKEPDLLDMAAQVDTVPVLAAREMALYVRSEVALADHLEESGLVPHPRWAAALLFTSARVFAHDHRRRFIAGEAIEASLAQLKTQLSHHLNTVMALAVRARPNALTGNDQEAVMSGSGRRMPETSL